jgi:hypothetical protein
MFTKMLTASLIAILPTMALAERNESRTDKGGPVSSASASGSGTTLIYSLHGVPLTYPVTKDVPLGYEQYAGHCPGCYWGLGCSS